MLVHLSWVLTVFLIVYFLQLNFGLLLSNPVLFTKYFVYLIHFYLINTLKFTNHTTSIWFIDTLLEDYPEL